MLPPGAFDLELGTPEEFVQKRKLFILYLESQHQLK